MVAAVAVEGWGAAAVTVEVELEVALARAVKYVVAMAARGETVLLEVAKG